MKVWILIAIEGLNPDFSKVEANPKNKLPQIMDVGYMVSSISLQNV